MAVLLQHTEAPSPPPDDPPERPVTVMQSGRTWFPEGQLDCIRPPPPLPVSYNITLNDISHGHRNPWIHLRTPNWLEWIWSEKSRLPGVTGHPRQADPFFCSEWLSHTWQRSTMSRMGVSGGTLSRCLRRVARYCFHPVCLCVCLCVCICVSGQYFGILFLGY